MVAECCGSFGGPTKDGWALNARAVGGIGPVAEVENRLAAMLGLEVVIEGDGAVGVEELVGDVGQDGGAARGDATFGDEDKEQGEELGDVDGGVELGELGEKFRVEVGGNHLAVAEVRRRWRHSRLSVEDKDPDGNRMRISGSACRWGIWAGNGPHSREF